MDYEEALDTILSAAQARREIVAHHLPFNDFQAEVGVKDAYAGADVLNWLGY